MKNIVKGFIAVMALMLVLAGCSSSKAGSHKMGVASHQVVAETANDDNAVVFDTVVAGVLLGDDKVVYVSIDQSEQFATVENDTVVSEVLPTKKVRGNDYGLLGASQQTGLGKEWMDQIAGIEADLIGKTLAEVKDYFAGEDVTSSATIGVDDIAATVVKAIENAVEVSNVDKVALGYIPSVAVKGEGLKPESVLEYAMLAVDADNKIVKVLLDTAQELAEYDGTWTLVNVNKTKGELKEDYNMKGASPIDKEWYQQNDALMAHLEGLSVDEALAVSTSDDDLNTSVTMTIDGVLAAIKNASENLVSVK